MRKFLLCVLMGGVLSLPAFSQTVMKPYTGGQTFTLQLPEYMNRTMGLNDAAAFQYESKVKDVYGFVIVDPKVELTLANLHFSTVNEFYDDFIGNFLIDQKNRKVSSSKFQQKEGIKFVESDVSYYDADAKADIYYLIGIVETKSAFYKVLSWSTLANKSKFKADFQRILYSLKD